MTSSFDHALAGYTTPLQKESKDFKDVEAKASKIANEIESSTYYKNRIELENGDEVCWLCFINYNTMYSIYVYI